MVLNFVILLFASLKEVISNLRSTKQLLSLFPKTTIPPLWKISYPFPFAITYKIISKVLANRLKTILPKCISQEQLAFAEECFVLDNVLLAYKIIHHVMMQSSQGGDPSPEPWLGDFKKVGVGMQEKALGFSWALG